MLLLPLNQHESDTMAESKSTKNTTSRQLRRLEVGSTLRAMYLTRLNALVDYYT